MPKDDSVVVERLRKDAGVPVEHVVAELPSAAPLEGLRQ